MRETIRQAERKTHKSEGRGRVRETIMENRSQKKAQLQCSPLEHCSWASVLERGERSEREESGMKRAVDKIAAPSTNHLLLRSAPPSSPIADLTHPNGDAGDNSKMDENRFIRSKGSLNRSQCKDCSAAYNPLTSSQVVFKRSCTPTYTTQSSMEWTTERELKRTARSTMGFELRDDERPA